MKLLKFLLFPFALLFGLGVFFRKKLYDLGILRRIKFDVPVLCVGNISAGGTGKTPHIEYLIRLLQDNYKLATLSRGYGRRSAGFKIASDSNALEIGDEPAQFEAKFPNIVVAVGESRTLAIPAILSEFPDTNLILLDDAYQHLSVLPGITILLTDIENLFTVDYLLPMGRLREFRRGYKRADIIVITRSPHDISPVERHRILEKINPFPYQKVYFSHVDYEDIYPLGDPKDKRALSSDMDGLLVTGISNPFGLKAYVENQVNSLNMMRFSDHHYFTETDMSYIKSNFDKISGSNRIILTTEKDAQRFALHDQWIKEHDLPIFCVPISVSFDEHDKKNFDQQIFDYLRSSIA